MKNDNGYHDEKISDMKTSFLETSSETSLTAIQGQN